MTRYATALANPAATYRQIDLAGRTTGADSHRLVGLLYEEGVAALRAAACAAEGRQYAIKSERVARATAILFALEAGLDFDRGGEVSRTLATFYHGLRQEVLHASIGTDPAPFREAATSLEEIGSAWASVRAS
ncbi:flagellar protein FliS [Sphingomonas naasensis]|uniref:Flagellar protein FliS n=1 Tax=Sphingomonas naasensis TaxID=1344951 RepID=A0A4S1W5X7_9SPHN|nr:flagellar protein FliS [Sphingomonas naasensis]NIJ21158.1 flagellar protein FliS [Sphingomonas naasensis]TGX38261.1 flagellar protein FliS [Sphingomonas naasensis]